jgi:hypothetical protein
MQPEEGRKACQHGDLLAQNSMAAKALSKVIELVAACC